MVIRQRLLVLPPNDLYNQVSEVSSGGLIDLPGSSMSCAARHWKQSLAEWAIPRHIIENAPRNPWEFPPALFARIAEQALANSLMSVSRDRVIEVLPVGGSVLDVGVGGGAASLPLSPPAGLLVGVDELDAMLAAFAEKAEALRIPHREVSGRWPDVAKVVEPADVVVCHHILFNVPDLVPFVSALTNHARFRVVVEMTRDHPTSAYNPLWLALHGIERPTSPTSDDALEVIRAMGIDVEHEEFDQPWSGPGGDRDEVVAFVSRRLCLGPERASEVDALLGPDLDSSIRKVVTAWWSGQALR